MTMSYRVLGGTGIELHQVPRPDENPDVEEPLSVLPALVRRGKIGAFGCPTFSAGEIVESPHVAEGRGLGRFRTEQPPYSILARGIETAVLPVCQRYRMGVLVWSPLASGFLSGRYRRGHAGDPSSGRPAPAPPPLDPPGPG